MRTPAKPSPQDLRFIRLPKIIQRTGWRKSSIYAAVAAGKFPRPVKLGSKTSAWLEHEVDQWCAEQVIAARGPASVAMDEVA